MLGRAPGLLSCPIESCPFWSLPLCKVSTGHTWKPISCITVQEAQWRNFWKAKSSCHRYVSYLGKYSIVPHTFYFPSVRTWYWCSFCKFSLFRKQDLLVFLLLLSEALTARNVFSSWNTFLKQKKNAWACSWLHMYIVLIFMSIGPETESEE